MPKCTSKKLSFGRMGRREIEAYFEGGAIRKDHWEHIKKTLCKDRYPSTPKGPKLRNGRLEVEFRGKRLKRAVWKH